MRHLFALLFALLPTLSHGSAGASGHAVLHGGIGCAVAELQGEGCTAYICPSSGGTACVASFALGVHGFDVAQAGMRQLITGEEVLPVGVQLMMRATGMNATQAGLAYDLVTLGFEMATVRAIANQGENALSLYHQQAFRGGGANTATIGGTACVYSCVVDGVTRYVGITNDVARRGSEHLRTRGIVIEEIAGLDGLSRADARAVEQTLIHYYGLGRDGGTLLNRINSISPTRNPTAYEQALIRGRELLDDVDYQWTQ